MSEFDNSRPIDDKERPVQQNHGLEQNIGEIALSDDGLRVQRDTLISVMWASHPERSLSDAKRAEINACSARELNDRLSRLREQFEFGVSCYPSTKYKPEHIDDMRQLLTQMCLGISPQTIVKQNEWTNAHYKVREKSLFIFLNKVDLAFREGDPKLLPERIYQRQYKADRPMYGY